MESLKACNFIKKKTPTQLFSCAYCEIFKTTFFIEHLRWLPLHIENASMITTMYDTENSQAWHKQSCKLLVEVEVFLNVFLSLVLWVVG